MICNSPAATPMVASVTMKSDSRRTVINSPLISPHSAPTASPASTAGKVAKPKVKHSMVTPPLRPSTEPTDRSIAPAVSTNVIPTAMIRTNIDCTMMADRLSVDRKAGFSSPSRAITRIRARVIDTPSICSTLARFWRMCVIPVVGEEARRRQAT